MYFSSRIERESYFIDNLFAANSENDSPVKVRRKSNGGEDKLIGCARAPACVADVPAVTVCLASAHNSQHRLLNLFLERPSVTTELTVSTQLITALIIIQEWSDCISAILPFWKQKNTADLNIGNGQ